MLLPVSTNELQCRSPKDYFAVVDSLEQKEADGRYSHFELLSCKCVDTYVKVKKNQSQICWKWRKVNLQLENVNNQCMVLQSWCHPIQCLSPGLTCCM